jgi:uncharacterized protein with NAD-binding domain and iron-sulfur cluster
VTDRSPLGSARPVRVAILGGGCGGLAAAWRLTATPALRRRFEVTVYELGWQLGGKGASGRMPHPAGEAGRGQRIEEHGLHIWFGFYEHAFRMLRAAYEEAGLASGEGWWKVPFEKCNSVSLYERRDDDTWVRQSVALPARGGANHGPPTEHRRVTLGRALARTTRLLATGLRADLVGAAPRRGASAPAEGTTRGLAGTALILDQLADEIDRMQSPLTLDADDASGPLTRGRLRFAQPRARGAREAVVEPLVDRLLAHVRELQRAVAEEEITDRVRLWRGVLELVAASLAGIIRDDVLWRGFGALDEEDLRDWLRRHGAGAETLERSPVLRGLYDLTFAYRAGDKRQPSLAAGKGLQSLLMMINYEGAFMWRMRAGMGDVVFSPLYLALRKRGVRFEFFSRVTRLGLMPGRPIVDAIELSRDATVVAGADRYEPLRRIGDWWCWPATPDQGQLSDAEPRRQTLRRGSQFDDVVLAIPVGAQGEICGELTAANPRFKQMLEGAETVRTKALQVWLTRPIEELAARRGDDQPGLDPPATAYAEPFDTYCDMSHLLDAEGYDGVDGPKAVAYFCAVLPDFTDAVQAQRAVHSGAVEYLERRARVIWPGAFSEGAFDWNVVFDPLGRSGPARLEAQYLRANVEPTDRYVMTPAGSVDSRLDPDRSGFENLVLAGDWTHNGIDGGCVEAAVISGERAAEGLIARRAADRSPTLRGSRYVDYGALATAPGPLLCERARLYCFFVKTDRPRVQQLCDRALKQPTGGSLRYRVSRLAPVVLSFGVIAGLRSLHPDHAGRGSASEPEAAIWVPAIAQRLEGGRYVDDHLAIFMPYIWVDDPIAFASGREVYGFAKTQGWMRPLEDPRGHGEPPRRADEIPDPPEELALDVHGAAEYGPGAELGRERLITIRRRGARRGAPSDGPPRAFAEGAEMAPLIKHCLSELEPGFELGDGAAPRRSALQRRGSGARLRGSLLAELLADQAVRHVFLKQIRDAEHGELAALQQVVEARSSVTRGSLRWRSLRGSYELTMRSLESHPLEDELGLAPQQTIRLAFAAEFGFRMEPGVVRWP